jgi:hypothetical protein
MRIKIHLYRNVLHQYAFWTFRSRSKPKNGPKFSKFDFGLKRQHLPCDSNFQFLVDSIHEVGERLSVVESILNTAKHGGAKHFLYQNAH